jgi:hypothetical protein
MYHRQLPRPAFAEHTNLDFVSQRTNILWQCDICEGAKFRAHTTAEQAVSRCAKKFAHFSGALRETKLEESFGDTNVVARRDRRVHI